jgi:hypothetical protein
VKTRLSGLLLWGALLLGGCAMTDSVRDRVADDSPAHSHVFAAEPRAAYASLRLALNEMGYKFSRGGPAEGWLDALSPILPGDAGENARQVSLHAEFQAVEGGTEVRLTLKEIIEDSSEHLGMATTTPLRDTPLYEVFFHAIQADLANATP